MELSAQEFEFYRRQIDLLGPENHDKLRTAKVLLGRRGMQALANRSQGVQKIFSAKFFSLRINYCDISFNDRSASRRGDRADSCRLPVRLSSYLRGIIFGALS